MKTLGVISDTHGLLRPEAIAALEGVDAIVHAGDIGDVDIITTLESIAPVTAIRGNVDRGAVAARFPATQCFEFEGIHLYVLHDLHELDLDPIAAEVQVVIAGHTHQPSVQNRKGVLYLNPGSAGPRRFQLPVSIATIHVGAQGPVARIIELEV